MTTFRSENEKYSVVDAVRDTLAAWEAGTTKLGWQITEEVRGKVYPRTGRRPLDSTILRYVRLYRDVYGIAPVEGKKGSVYRKEGKEEA